MVSSMSLCPPSQDSQLYEECHEYIRPEQALSLRQEFAAIGDNNGIEFKNHDKIESKVDKLSVVL